MSSIKAIIVLEKVERVMIKVSMILHRQDIAELSPETKFSGPLHCRAHHRSDESSLGTHNRNTREKAL